MGATETGGAAEEASPDSAGAEADEGSSGAADEGEPDSSAPSEGPAAADELPELKHSVEVPAWIWKGCQQWRHTTAFSIVTLHSTAFKEGGRRTVTGAE